MNARHAAVLLLGLAAVPHGLDAQVRDAAPVATGAASITGAVMSDATPARPLRRAVVTINADPDIGRTTITDDAGRFAFLSLPPGRYTVSANKRGWVPTVYGAKAIGRPGRAIQLIAGDHATAAIRMARRAVITGTILDQNGQPPNGVVLRVLRYAYAMNTGERRLSTAPYSNSGPDDRGYYRIYDINPGEYYISVASSSGVFSPGRDLHLTSDVDVQEALKATQDGAASPMTDVRQRNVGLAQVFYPGTTSVAQATPVTVRAGEERSGIDFTVQYVPTARVEGTIASPLGPAPVGTQVMLVMNDPATGATGFEAIRNARTSADGHFEFAEVAPGPYILSARTTLPLPTGVSGPPQVVSAITDVDVSGEDMRGLSLLMQEGFTVSGTVRFEGTGTPPNLASFRVGLTPVQSGSTVTVSTSGTTTITDGRFTIVGVTPGRYRLTVGQPTPTPWATRSSFGQGQDALDTPVDIRQAISDAVITISDRLSELNGKVEAPGNASPDYSIVLFSTDRAHWAPQSRRIRNARTANDGTFSFRNVQPGEYYLAAVDDVEPGEWFDPAFLERAAAGAMKITIAEGEKKVQDIRIGGG